MVIPRTIPGFVGALGPDRSYLGFTQCFGWYNNGSTAAISYAAFRTACGSGTTIVFAGQRSGLGTLIWQEAELSQPFLNYLPATLPVSTFFINSFDIAGRYTFALGAPWILLAVQGNNWSDPGRLWEINLQGGVTAADGHVLSQDGNQANDQYQVTGERYFIYMR